jgi:hypothetical protein
VTHSITPGCMVTREAWRCFVENECHTFVHTLHRCPHWRMPSVTRSTVALVLVANRHRQQAELTHGTWSDSYQLTFRLNCVGQYTRCCCPYHPHRCCGRCVRRCCCHRRSFLYHPRADRSRCWAARPFSWIAELPCRWFLTAGLVIQTKLIRPSRLSNDTHISEYVQPRSNEGWLATVDLKRSNGQHSRGSFQEDMRA